MTSVLGYRTSAIQALRGADLTGKTAVITGTDACNVLQSTLLFALGLVSITDMFITSMC